MKLAQLFSDFEEELIRQGEEAESLSFVYRSLKKLSFTDFVFVKNHRSSPLKCDWSFSLFFK